MTPFLLLLPPPPLIRVSDAQAHKHTLPQERVLEPKASQLPKQQL